MRVHDFFHFGGRVVDFTGLFTQSRAASHGRWLGVNRTTVVVAHLDQDEIAGLAGCKDLVPAAFALKRTAGAAGDGMVFHLDLVLSKKCLLRT